MSRAKQFRKIVHQGMFVAVLGATFAAPSFGAAVYLKDLATDFTAYDYNTAAYQVAPYGFIGCGPTTGAMILNYFQNEYSAAGLMEAGGGLATAKTLHGAGDGVGPYMQTGTDGFGSVYRIEPGMEGYASSKGYTIDVMVHVNPTYTPPNATWDAYGPFGSSWTNDADYMVYDAATNKWSIDDQKFYDFASASLAAGAPIFLTVDSDGNGSGDHWVPLVGIDLGTYYYYDTYDTTLHSADVAYLGERAGAWTISLARTVTFIGGSGPGGNGGGNVPEPGTLTLIAAALMILRAMRIGTGKRDA